MLDAMRRASESWYGRVLMAVVLGFIVFSFVIWGIGDIFTGFGSDTLAKVGSQSITTQQFSSAYDLQLNQLQQQQRRPITAQQAHAMGLDTQVLTGLIANAVLDQQAKQLGLALSDKQVVDAIVADPSFQGPDGKFDASAFANLLEQNGMTQDAFVSQQRDLELRREIADSVISDLAIPRTMLDAVDQFRNETRSVDYFTLTASAAGDIPAPSDKELEAYFNERREEWGAPEYRSLVALSVTPKSIADPNDVSDASARAEYDAKKASYGKPEKRDILQATFPNEQAAADAAAKIKGGEAFAAAVKDEKGTVVDLGMILRAGLFDPAIAQAAFSVPAGGVSAPVKGQFGWVLVQAAKVQPATYEPFAQVAPAIKAAIAQANAAPKIAAIRDKIEDLRTSGKTLTEAAQAVGLKTEKLPPVDAQGLDKDGKPAALPDKKALLQAAFASDVGVDNDVLTTPDGGDVWFEVTNVDPAHQRAFAEVKSKALDAWRQDQVEERLGKIGRELVDKLNDGAPIASLAKTYGAKVQTVTDVKRIGTADLAPTVVASVFDAPVHSGGTAETNARTRTVFWVNDSQTPPVDPNSEINKAVSANLQQQMSDDILSEYLDALQSKDGVSVNQAAMASAVSGEEQQ